MRITDSQNSRFTIDHLNTGNTELAMVMKQISSGNRINRISDDPVGALSLNAVRQATSQIEQYTENINASSTALTAQEINLSGISDTLMRLRDLALYSANGTQSENELRGFKIEMEALTEGLVSQLNFQDSKGRYIFSGTKTDQAPMTKSPLGDYVINANDAARQVIVGKGVFVNTTMSAKDIVNVGNNNLINDLIAYFNELETGTPSQGSGATIAGTIGEAFSKTQQALTELGGRQNHLSNVKNGHTENRLSLSRVKQEIEMVDIAEASVKLNSYMNSLEASQLAYRRISDLSLFKLI